MGIEVVRQLLSSDELPDQDNHLELFMKKELLATINTNNRTVSNTSMIKELAMSYKNMDENNGTIIKLLKNTVEISFAVDHVKEEILREVEDVKWG